MIRGRIRLFLDRIGEQGFFKIMFLISIISITFILFFFYNQNHSIVAFLGIFSNIIEISMLLIWLKKEDFPVEDIVQIKEDLNITKESMKEVKEYLFNKETKDERKIRLVKKLVEVGAVPEKEIYKLLRRKNDIFVVYTYGEGIPKRLRPLCGGKPPLIGFLEEIGFVRVAPNQNLFVIFSKWLPPNLRNTSTLRNFIKKELLRRWEILSERIREKYPETEYKIFEKWRTKEGFKASFIVMRCPGYEFIMDFIRKVSFHPQFQEKILRGVDWDQLRKFIKKRKYEIRKFLSKISIEILLEEVPRNHREIILQNEDHIKSALGSRSFIDFRFLKNNKNFISLLVRLIPGLEESMAKKYTEIISRESQKYYSTLKELGIYLD